MPLPDQSTRIYRIWITVLAGMVAGAIWFYLRQMDAGLGITGMSRDVTWGLYIGQFTFADGLAASAALLLLPNFPGKSALYGQFVAIAGVIACMLFIVADMGQPSLVLNVLRYPSPHSLMFWDMISLSGYLALNGVMAATTLDCESKDIPPPRWLRTVMLVSIPWAIGMQTVSAFLFCGLPGRSFWLSAILAPRFIVSACVSGSALMVLLLLVLRSGEPVRKLANVVSYAMLLNIFFMLLELFTAFYSGVPEPAEHFRAIAPWMSTSMILGIMSLLLLRNGKRLALGCAAALISVWVDKGLGMVIGGFVPSPLGAATQYTPTAPEIAIAAGIWAAAALVATLLFRVSIAVRSYARGNSELQLLEQEVSH